MATDKYLQRYAEPEAQLDYSNVTPAKNCLVIPCYNEATELITRLQSLLATNPATLIILVINQPEGTAPTAENQSLATAAKNLGSQVLIIDRFSLGQQIPVKQGVGLARKIGCDIACQLIQKNLVSSPWIHTSDADVTWPADYFTATNNISGSAAIYPFQHTPRTEPHGLAISLYELSLRYYVHSLHYASSPYAYHTVGSTLVIHAEHYAKVRGFPRRSAGEDFHLLNKLSKTGNIAQLSRPILTIEDRYSARTPFGTGPAVTSLNAMTKPAEEYVYYHPNCFVELKHWLTLIPELYAKQNVAVAMAHIQNHASSALLQALQAAKIESLLSHAFNHSGNQATFVNHCHTKFDALSTLQLIHHLRDNAYPSINCQQLLTQPSFFSDDVQPALEQISEQNPLLQVNQQWITLINQHLLNLQQQSHGQAT